MKNLKNIKTFMFDSAKYHLTDGIKDGVLLKINYKNNNYSVEDKGELANNIFRKEINKLAKDLLKRKHGIDFAKRVRLDE